MLPHERYRLAPRDDWISFDVVGVEHGTLVEDDLERAFKRVLRSTLKSCRDSKSFEKTLPSVDILLKDGKKERVVAGLATNLVAALSPHVDGVHLCKGEEPVTELWEYVRLFDGRWIHGVTRGQQVSCRLTDAIVGHEQSIIISKIPCIL
ncbi:hypothetical protein SAMN05444422_11410 [Halobiforma haloterrestris]|uniref:Uncharacterized protein n=1 Tax=Natronobacterium haloterrestre TaxID=148448 RepID=A0A1I1L2D5_NATHA|nr:hypothetical protein SAMN05444422_11410 [Halobiforma haloterrestris]